MLFLTLEVVTIWLTVALVAGLALGSLISSAEKMRHEESLEAIFARVAGERFVR
jgi:hypothetical protein